MSGKLKVKTFGAELECADVDTKIKLPPCGEYDYKDYSIANSNGAAIDPQKKINRYGSEIHTKPADSTSDLAFMALKIFETFPRVNFNFTTSLHIHVHVPGLRDNLNALRHVSSYIKENQEEAFHLADPIPIPSVDEYQKHEEFLGAWGWYKHRRRSHQSRVSPAIHSARMFAKTPEEFHLAHAPKDRMGKPMFHLTQRAGINMAHLWKPTQTIEFRFFVMSDTFEYIESAAILCEKMVNSALTGEWQSPRDIIRKYGLKFQRFHPYRYKKERIWLLTHTQKNTREEVLDNYAVLFNTGVLKRREVI